MPGRIETYVHSDSSTQNKGGAIVEVTCQTDFAAKTPEFAAFAKKVARMAYAASGAYAQESKDLAQVSWKDIVNLFPDLESEREALAKEIKEQIGLRQALILALVPHWSVSDDI